MSEKKPRPASPEVPLLEAIEELHNTFLRLCRVEEPPNDGKLGCTYCNGTGLMPFGPTHAVEMVPCLCKKRDDP